MCCTRSTSSSQNPLGGIGEVSPVYWKIRTPVNMFTRSAARMSRPASTNDGMLRMINDSTVMTRSLSRYCRIAPQAPTMTPISVPSTEPVTTSRRLIPIRRHSSWETG